METMLKACAYFDSYQRGTNCRAWLFQICKNSFINEYRRRQHAPVAVDCQDEEIHSFADPREWSPHPSLLRDETDQDVQHRWLSDNTANALDGVPVAYRTCVILSDIEGQTYKEIADFTGVPIGTVRSRIHRGRKILAALLKKE